MRKLLKREKGITLIALIITIIVMLILVIVSVRVALNTGVFESAGKATKDWKTTQDAETELGNGKVNIGGTIYNNVDEYVTGISAANEVHNWTRNGETVNCSHCSTTLSIGEELNYTKTGTGSSSITEEKSGIAQAKLDGKSWANGLENQTINKDSETKWVVLGIDDKNNNGTNETLLITTLTPTTEKIRMYGLPAYENAIDELNRICKELYGEEAKSMTIEDINNCLQYKPKGGIYALRDATGKRTFYTTGNFETPINSDEYKTETTTLKQVWEKIQENAYTDDNGIKKYFTPEYPEGTTDKDKIGEYVIDGYYYSISTDRTYLIEPFNENDTSKKTTETVANLIFGKQGVYYTYWLASCGVHAVNDYAYFGPGRVAYLSAHSYLDTYLSNGTSSGYLLSVRAVIPLTDEIPSSLGMPET